VAFVRTEQRARDPVVPPALLRRRTMAVAVGAGFLAGAAMFGAISYVPLYAQGVLGTGPTGAGAALMPLMLAWVTFSVLGGRLLLRIGYRPTAIAGLGLLTTGFVLLGLLKGSSRALFHADLALFGAGLGLTMLTLLLAVQQSVPREQLGLATSVNQLARSLGGAVGVGVMGVLLAYGLATGAGPDADVAALIVPEGGAGAAAPGRAVVQAALADALGRVFLLAAALAALALVVVVAWLPGGGAPTEEECCPETGERMVAAEMATFDAGHEPEAVMGEARATLARPDGASSAR
jgi:predicted MFS family arabinose efflux permease